MTAKDILKEKIKREKKEAYQRNPMYWLEDRFGESPENFQWSLFPEYKNHKWDGDKDPLVKAWNDIADFHKIVALEAGTGTSKTYWLSRVIYWFLDCFEDSQVVTTAPKEAQLKLNLWAEIGKSFHKFKKIRPTAQLLSLEIRVDGLNKGQDVKSTNQFVQRREEEPDYTNSWHCVGIVAGVDAGEESANRARGFHRKYQLIILEETPGVSPAVIEAFENTNSGDYNVMLAVGNPDNELDELHKLAIRPDTKNYRISAYDYPNVVMKTDIFPGGTGLKSISSRAIKYGKGSNFYNRMIRGICPAQSADSLIQLDWLNNAINREVEFDNSYNALGVDVANSEAGDKASLCWGRGNTIEKLETFYCNNATHLAYNLIMSEQELMEKGYENYNTSKADDYLLHSDCIGVDAVGVGVATVNAMVDNGWMVTALSGGVWKEVLPKDEQGKELYNFGSLRSQMYWELREDLRMGKISILVNDEQVLNQLRQELTAPRFITTGNTVQVEKKDNIKKRLSRSPDIGDSVVYWNWVRKGYKKGVDGIMFA